MISGTPKSFNKNKIVFIVKILISIAIIFYLIHFLKTGTIFKALKDADYSLIFFTFLLGIINIYVQFLRWKLICSLSGEKDNKAIIRSLFLGFAGGFTTPMRLGEYVGRTLPFEKSKAVGVTAGTLLDKIVSLLLFLVFGSASVIIFLHAYYFYSTSITAFALISLCVICAMAYFYFIKYESKVRHRSEKENSGKFAGQFLTQFSAFYFLDKKIKLKLIIYSLFLFVILILQFALLGVAFSGQWHIVQFMWAGILIMFVKTILPFSLAELGIRESASVFFITKMGYSAVTGFNTSIMIFFINVLLPSLIGAILLISREEKWKL